MQLRPVNVLVKPEDVMDSLNPNQQRLYRLIWCRAVASLMKPARDKHVTVHIGPPDGTLQLTARGQWNTFAGFLAAYHHTDEPADAHDEDAHEQQGAPRTARQELAKRLAALPVGAPLTLVDVEVVRVDPPPPARYTEASLVAALTMLGIGRPSTYASVLATLQVAFVLVSMCVTTSMLQDRKYVRKSKGHLTPTPLARLVVPFLCLYFERFMQFDYTAKLEEALDDIAAGRKDWEALLADEMQALRGMVQRVMDRSQSEVLTELFDHLEEYFMPVR